MSPHQQISALAALVGWEPETETMPGGHEVVSKPPDYLTDLNAMHAVERWMRGKQIPDVSGRPSLDAWAWYRNFLSAVCGEIPMWHATAAQKAEATLKVWGLWQNAPGDEPPSNT